MSVIKFVASIKNGVKNFMNSKTEERASGRFSLIS
jgi:hypothetical protein